jgi:cell division protein ZipA
VDATTLRIVLFVAGLIFLGGIYLYETRRRKRESAQAKRRIDPHVDHTPPIGDENSDEDSEPAFEPDRLVDEAPSLGAAVGDDEITELLDHDEPADTYGSFRIDDEPIPGIDEPVSASDKPTQTEVAEPPPTRATSPAMEQQDLFGFSAQEESPIDVPDLIIQINVRARKEPFDGEAIAKAMQETGMVLSDLAIYQRLASDGSRKVLYNLASMVEPGVFPSRDLSGFSTPGLTLFAQLPGPGDSLMIFSDMLYTAERLAAMLVGDLQDETHSVLSKQTIEHLRERIMEHKRQIQLARRKG